MMLTEKDDVVVGCITNYNFEQIKPWVNSLDRCGFKGHKVVLCYNISSDVVAELTKRNYTILAFSQDAEGNCVYNDGKPFSIVVERFFHLWIMLKELKGKHRFLIHTDVKDVIFQRNPSEYLERFGVRVNIVAASECLEYEDEDWGRQNMQDSFGPLIYEKMKQEEIVNAGTLSGRFDYLVDFFLNVYMLCTGAKTHNPDQAAVNILLSQESYMDGLFVTQYSDAWAAQLGTTHDPNKKHYLPKLTEKEAQFAYLDGTEPDLMFKNADGKPFYMVHQYDRLDANTRERILKKYG